MHSLAIQSHSPSSISSITLLHEIRISICLCPHPSKHAIKLLPSFLYSPTLSHLPSTPRSSSRLQLEAGKMDIHETEFSIWSCLDFCMEMLVLKSQTRGLDLSYNVHPSVPR